MIPTVVDALILDLLEWLAKKDRSYEDVMGALRTSCPRLPIWEEANDRGLVKTQEVDGLCVVRVSSSGHALLERRKSLRSETLDGTAGSIGRSRLTIARLDARTSLTDLRPTVRAIAKRQRNLRSLNPNTYPADQSASPKAPTAKPPSAPAGQKPSPETISS
jgi:hypothetical protein